MKSEIKLELFVDGQIKTFTLNEILQALHLPSDEDASVSLSIERTGNMERTEKLTACAQNWLTMPQISLEAEIDEDEYMLADATLASPDTPYLTSQLYKGKKDYNGTDDEPIAWMCHGKRNRKDKSRRMLYTNSDYACVSTQSNADIEDGRWENAKVTEAGSVPPNNWNKKAFGLSLICKDTIAAMNKLKEKELRLQHLEQKGIYSPTEKQKASLEPFWCLEDSKTFDMWDWAINQFSVCLGTTLHSCDEIIPEEFKNESIGEETGGCQQGLPLLTQRYFDVFRNLVNCLRDDPSAPASYYICLPMLNSCMLPFDTLEDAYLFREKIDCLDSTVKESEKNNNTPQ